MAESTFILGLNPWSSNQIMNHFPDPIHRILLIRLSALGDCFCAFPVFAALRTHFPHAHIAWAIQDNFAPLIQNLPGLDEIILFPRQRWKRSSWFTQLTEGRQLIRRLGMRRFDLTIDVQSNTKSGAVAWATRAPLRICHGGEEAKELTQWLNNKPIPPSAEMPHIIQRNLHLLSPLGIPEASPRFPLPPDPFAKATVRRWLEEKGLRPGEYFLLIPFCGNQNKEWPPEQFTRLSQILAQHNQATVFLNGPGKEAETQALLPCNHGQIFLGPRTSILEMVELVRSAHIVVGGDTGPVQIAGGLDIPVAGLFGPTAPERSRPWGRHVIMPLQAEPEEIWQAIAHLS